MTKSDIFAAAHKIAKKDPASAPYSFKLSVALQRVHSRSHGLVAKTSKGHEVNIEFFGSTQSGSYSLKAVACYKGEEAIGFFTKKNGVPALSLTLPTALCKDAGVKKGTKG